MSEPRMIMLPESPGKGGLLSYVEEGENLLFKVKRVYWTYGIDKVVDRGKHAHEFSHRLIVCLHGSIEIEITNVYEEVYRFTLSKPNQAVYFPPRHWISMKCSASAVMIALASHLYEDDELITDFDEFLALGQL